MSVEAWQREVDDYYSVLRGLPNMEPEEQFEALSGIGARIAEIRTQTTRTPDRVYGAFRTNELDPMLAQCEYQFRVCSRLVAVQQSEAALAGRTI